VKRKFNRLDLLMPSPEDILKITAHQEVLEETLQAKPLKPSTSIEATPEITTQEEVVEGALQKEISADASVEEITEYRAMHEIITGFNKQNNFADAAAAIGGTEEEVCETIIGEKLLDHSESYIFTEDPVTPEGVPEGISDNDIASISEEERTAMSRDHNSVEMAGFIGIINAQPNPAYKGLPVNIAYTLRNVACDNPNDFIVQIIVVNPDTGIIYETFETPVKCRKGTFSMGGFVIFTTSYETYTYRLNMQIASEKTKTSHLLTGISLEIKSIF
jgi:hypothetical protein